MSAKRDAKGRFLKGQAPKSPGRPPLHAELDFKEGIKAATSAESVAQVLEKMRDMALGGDVKAATLYLAYALGKPKESLDLTSDGEKLAAPIVYLPEVKSADEP